MNWNYFIGIDVSKLSVEIPASRDLQSRLISFGFVIQ
jgi:hypothetical protein